MRAAIVLVVYALLLLAGGLYAYAAAPEGANAKTALIVPGACAAVVLVCAAMAAMFSRNRRLGMIGIHAGLVVPLLFAVALGQRAWKSTQTVERFHVVNAEYQEALEGDPTLAEPDARREFFRSRGTIDHDAAYLRNTLWGLTGLSVAAFLALLVLRPRPEKRERHEIPKVLQSEEHPIGAPSNSPPLEPPPDNAESRP